MPRVRAVIERHADADYVTFQDDLGNRNLGRKCRFTSQTLVIEMLQRAGASLSLQEVIAKDLRDQARSFVVLNLTQEQYARLTDGRPAPKTDERGYP